MPLGTQDGETLRIWPRTKNPPGSLFRAISLFAAVMNLRVDPDFGRVCVNAAGRAELAHEQPTGLAVEAALTK
jgi:hypothetical protein